MEVRIDGKVIAVHLEWRRKLVISFCKSGALTMCRMIFCCELFDGEGQIGCRGIVFEGGSLDWHQ